MIRGLSYLIGLLYCFVWLRPPEIGGIALPIQRVLGWLGLAFLLSHLLLKGSLTAGPVARRYLRLAAAFTFLLILSLVIQLAYGERFVLLYFGMDLSKYAAVFTVAYLCYYALTTRLVERRPLPGRDHDLRGAGYRARVSVAGHVGRGISKQSRSAGAVVQRLGRRAAHRGLSPPGRPDRRAAATLRRSADSVAADALARADSPLVALRAAAPAWP